MKKKDYLEYSQAIKNILKNSLELYQRGEKAFYRVMAAQLRILLCDTTRRHGRIYDISLLPLLVSDLKLPVPPAPGLEPGSLPLSEWLSLELRLPKKPSASASWSGGCVTRTAAHMWTRNPKPACPTTKRCRNGL